MPQRNFLNSLSEITQREDFLRSVLENIADGIVISDLQAIIYINRALSDMTGYTPAEAIGKPTTMFRPPAQDKKAPPRWKVIFEELKEKEKIRILHDLYQTKDGRPIPVDINVSLLRDKTGKPIGSVAVIRDISQHEKMERELKVSEERFRNLVEIANDAIIIDDSKRNIVLFNRKAEEIFGYKREEVIGKNVSLLLPPCYQKKEREWYDKVAKTGTSPLLGRPIEMEGLHKDGSEIPLEFSFSMYRNEKGGFSMAVIRDIRERKKLERELIEKEKLTALMEMAGAIAHELNQPLTTILGSAEILMRKINERDPQFKQLSLIAKETQRLSGMIKKIRKVIRYETKPYLNDVKIIDLDKASKNKKP